MPTTTSPRRAPVRQRSKVLRYGVVTMVNVFLGLATLVFLHGSLGWHGVPAAVTAVIASAVPCFLLNRHYVWQRAGRVRVRAEVVPFSLFTLAGLVASSGLVYLASTRYDSSVMVYVAHQSAFGMLWVLRFLLFDRLLWHRRTPGTIRVLPFGSPRPVPAVEDLAA